MNQKTQIPNLPDLLEVQKSSFCWFLEKGLASELNQFSSLGTSNNSIDLKIFGHSYKLKKPDFTMVKAKRRKLTYGLKLYVNMELIYRLNEENEEERLEKLKEKHLEKLENFKVKEKQILAKYEEKKEKIKTKLAKEEKELEKAKTKKTKPKKVSSKKLSKEEEIVQFTKLEAEKIVSLANLEKKEKKVVEKYNQEKEHVVDKKQILLGQIPLMTAKGGFIINGYERVVVNQIIRSPGVYYKKEPGIYDRRKKKRYILYSGTVITRRGSWISFEFCKDSMWVKIDKQVKIPIFVFLAGLGFENEEIYQSLKNGKLYAKVDSESREALKTEIAKLRSDLIIKPSRKLKLKLDLLLDNSSTKTIQNLMTSRVLNPKYYDLGEVGRLKINEKLGLHLPLSSKILTSHDILRIIDHLLDIVYYNAEFDDIDNLANRRVRCVGELLQIQIRTGLNRIEKNLQIRSASFQYLASNNEEDKILKIKNLLNPKPFNGALKEFFGSSQLSQFLDETNPLSELTHKRRISSLGPGGLNSDHVSFAARDIHPTQYGRLCPIETPEGKNAGLVSSLASHAKVNKYGFIETPFYHVWKGKVLKEKPLLYLDASKEKLYKIASADIPLSSDHYIQNKIVPIRYNQEFTLAPFYEVNLVGISPIQIISTGASLIPFLEHDDANRALMGSNMQRQAVPLLFPQKPIVGTGLEAQIASDTCAGIFNTRKGKVSFVSANQIVVQSIIQKKQKKDKKHQNQLFYEKRRYHLQKYRRSNQETCLNHKPIVWPGQRVEKNQLLSDGFATKGGELALGQNLTVAYMPWEGYNYEDAILVSDKLLSLNLFTSIHIERYEIEICETKTGMEEMTKTLPHVSEKAVSKLDKHGLIKKGCLVKPGDILVGKVTPKGENDELPEARLLRAIFGYKLSEVRDTSLRLPKNVSGHVIDVLVFSKDKGDKLSLNALSLVRVFVAEIRKLKIGDKMAGRHGNKGIVSRILPFQDMPYLPDGSVVDLVFNPLGVPSRMNVGQLFEALLGLAGQELNQRFKILPFDEMHGLEASRVLINTKLQEAAFKTNKSWLFNSLCPGKVLLRDGRSGEYFDNPVLVGKSYILKLIHLVEDKIHARATGPYSLVTQQPLRGKSNNGGQRFGEMEVWALEAFGAAYTLRELLTLKSDDMDGRSEVVTAIVHGQALPEPGLPESFKVLLRELHALGLDITTYQIQQTKNGQIHVPEVNVLTTSISK